MLWCSTPDCAGGGPGGGGGGGLEAIGHAANNLGRNCDQYTIDHGIIIDIRLEALSFKIYAHYKGHEIYL